MITLKFYKQDSLIPTVKKISSFPCRIGRSISNHIVLDDPSISKTHALINFDTNGHYIMDLQSTNGIIKDGERTEILRLHHDNSFYLGALKIEVIADEERLEKTRMIHLPTSFLLRNQKKMMILAGLSFLFLISISYLYEYLLNPIDKKNFLNIIWTIISGFIVLAIISGGFALFSKIHLKKYRPFTFFTFFTLWSCIFILIFDFLPYLAFYINNDLIYKILFHTISYGFLIYSAWHLTCESFLHTPQKKLAIIFASVFIIIQSLIIITNALKDKNNFSYQGSLSYPLQTYDQEGHPKEKLYLSIQKSMLEIDKLRTKEIEKREREKEKLK